MPPGRLKKLSGAFSVGRASFRRIIEDSDNDSSEDLPKGIQGSGLCEIHGVRRGGCTRCFQAARCDCGLKWGKCLKCYNSYRFRELCQCGRTKHYCSKHGGRGICSHNRRRSRCKECFLLKKCKCGTVRKNCRRCSSKIKCKHHIPLLECDTCLRDNAKRIKIREADKGNPSAVEDDIVIYDEEPPQDLAPSGDSVEEAHVSPGPGSFSNEPASGGDEGPPGSPKRDDGSPGSPEVSVMEPSEQISVAEQEQKPKVYFSKMSLILSFSEDEDSDILLDRDIEMDPIQPVRPSRLKNYLDATSERSTETKVSRREYQSGENSYGPVTEVSCDSSTSSMSTEIKIEPLPVGPLPVGPLPVGPLPVGPLPVGPLPVGPLPVGPLPVGPPSSAEEDYGDDDYCPSHDNPSIDDPTSEVRQKRKRRRQVRKK